MAETEHFTICRLTESDAELLVSKGIGWRHGREPDWPEYFAKLELLQAEEVVRAAKSRLAELKAEKEGE